MMRKLFSIAAFLLASTAAQAQYTFDYGGRTIRIDPDKGTVSIPGVYDNTGKRKKSSRTDGDSKQTPQAKVDTKAPAAEPAPPPVAASPAPAPATATVAPGSDTITSVQPSADTPTSPAVQDTAPAARPAPPVVATAPAPPTTQPANSPIGVWLTEEKEGKVRIEPCGANLCGYSVDAKTNQNGDQVLINMKPGKDKW